MKRVAIATDSNSGIMPNEQIEGLFVVPMPFVIDGEEFFEGVNLTVDEFYEKQTHGSKIFTSQPTINDVVELWHKILQDYDEIVCIPMSSGLSNSCDTATTFAADFDGKVQVVNNQRISVTMKSSVYEALELAKNGASAVEIKKYLEDTKFDSSIYIMVDTLKYLKQGGRVTPTAAAIAAVLNVKPVLQIQGGKLDSFAKVLNVKSAKMKMIEAARKDLQTRFADLVRRGKMRVSVAHTQNEEMAKSFKEEIMKALPEVEFAYLDPLPLSIATHIGPKSLAIALHRTY
ncbi:MAG: DegV family protein [Clostridia bacterium]|nr:DegV family protein [Clostridia bacterium]